MIGNPTYYKNTFRTIAGLTNLVFDNDVVLLCDTSLGVVNLTLLEILADRFSTQYKLYIVDKSNNAGTNNITISAPIGFTVNNSSVAVVNVNNGVAVITISSNTTYNAQFNYIVGGGGAIVVKNEGTIITTNATSFNYVGADVTATALGGDVTVTIQSNFAIVTYAQLQVLITTNALVPSQDYLITNAIFLNTLPIETVPIVVKAITTNEVTISGSGIFLNADYQGVGDYSSVVGFVSNIGVFYVGIPCVIGDVTIWNNLQWVSLNGTSLLPPDVDPLSWTLLSKTSTNGYITEIDIIKYDVATNIITYREDIRNNQIENNINSAFLPYECFFVFQWGNNYCNNNTIEDESYIMVSNSRGRVNSNTISQNSTVDVRTAITGIFISNIIEASSYIYILNCEGEINFNLFHNINIISFGTNNSNSFINNIFKFGTGHTFRNLTNNASISNNIFTTNTKIYNILNSSEILNNIFEYSSANIEANTGEINNNNLQYSGIDIKDNSLEFNSNSLFQSNIQVTIANSGKINQNILNSNSAVAVNVNTNTIGNNELSSDSTLTIVINNNGLIVGNVLKNHSVITFQNNLAEFVGNVYNESAFTVNTNQGTINYNQWTTANVLIGINVLNNFSLNTWINTTFNISNSLTFDVTDTWVEEGFLNMAQLNHKIIGGIYQDNVGTIMYGLDMADPLIYNVGTRQLTIPIGLNRFIGVFFLINGGGQTIELIVNLQGKYATKFKNNDTNTAIRFSVLNSYNVALLDQLVSTTAPISYLVNCSLTSFQDSIAIRRNSNLNAIEQVYIYA